MQTAIYPSNTISLRELPPWFPGSVLDKMDGGVIDYTFQVSRPEKRIYKKKKYMPPSEWAPRYRVVTDGPFKGRLMDLEITPHLKGFVDASFFPSVRRIRNCKSVQVAGSVGIHTCLGYGMDRRPGTMLLALPDQALLGRTMRDRIKKMIEQSPVLKKLMTGLADDVATMRIALSVLEIYGAWSGSISSLGDLAAMYVVKEEADKWKREPSKNEASSHNSVDKRVTAFQYDSKIWDNSTPTVVSGHIWTVLTTETQIVSDFWPVCPDCGRGQVMTFHQIKWPGGVPRQEILAKRLARYVCRHCGVEWDDHRRNLAAQAGKYMSLPTKDWKDCIERLVEKKELDAMDDAKEMFSVLETMWPEDIGFYMPCWWSYFVSMSKPVNAFLKYVESGDLEELKDFQNNFAGLPWKHKTITKDKSEILKACCTLDPQVIPQEAIALTCFVDNQKRGFWFVVKAWARDYTSWTIHYGQLFTWDEVETLLFDTFYPVDGMPEKRKRIWRAAIDTGGGEGELGISMTEEAYFWLLENRFGRGCIVEGTKGASRPLAGKLQIGKALDKSPAGRPLPGGLRIIQLDTDKLKDTFHYRLKQAVENGPRASYLYAGDKDAHKEYINQITAEVKEGDVWIQKKKDNHLLDCEIGNIALADPEWPGGGVHLLQPAVEGERMVEREKEDTGDDDGSYERPDWLDRDR